MGWCLAGFAGLAAAYGNAARAARLFGAATAVHDALNAPMRSSVLAMYERILAPAQAVLGEAVFAAAMSAGRTLPLEEGVAEALSLPDELAGDVARPAAKLRAPPTHG